MKKRNLLISAVFLGVAGFLPACDLFEECGTCEWITIAADGTETRSAPLPYCGDELANKQDAAPITIGGVTTYWDCY
ncbi:MAG: hypothetical protein KAT15_10025 [Bacteroidales bacterium]|nr:hypothetical protein [Bacteroidales bacterium]